MKWMMVCAISVLFILGTSQPGYCPGGGYGGGYKDAPTYKSAPDGDANSRMKPDSASTLGKELMDLQEAYRKGAINEE